MSRHVLESTAVVPTVDYAALCEKHIPLVRHAVSAYAARLPGYVDVDDLTGAALLGLVEAARRFNPDLGVPFEAWALTRVRGAIFDAARSVDFASRKTRSQSRQVDAAVEQLTVRLRRTPTSAEITAEIGMSVEDLHALRARVHQGVVLSLDAQFLDEEDPGVGFAETLVDADMPPLEALERRELDAYVHDCVASLPERLRDLVHALFFEGRLASDVAVELGVTESRVSQLRTDALRLLREALGAQYGEMLAHPPKPASGGSSAPQGGATGGGGGAAPALSKRGQDVAKAAAARSTYGERLTDRTPVVL